jgi:hypothetical protein
MMIALAAKLLEKNLIVVDEMLMQVERRMHPSLSHSTSFLTS